MKNSIKNLFERTPIEIQCADDVSTTHYFTPPQPVRVDVAYFLESAKPRDNHGLTKGEQAALNMLRIYDHECAKSQPRYNKAPRLWMDWRGVSQEKLTLTMEVVGIAMAMLHEKGSEWLAANVTFVNIAPRVREIFLAYINKKEPTGHSVDAVRYAAHALRGSNQSHNDDDVPF